MQKVSVLGHINDASGVRMDPGKVAAIVKSKTPSNRTELIIFLGLAGYYRRFIWKFADISAELHTCTSKNVSFKWTTGMVEAFRTLKERLSTAPVLASPDFENPFIVYTGASSKAVGAVLVQKEV